MRFTPRSEEEGQTFVQVGGDVLDLRDIAPSTPILDVINALSSVGFDVDSFVGQNNLYLDVKRGRTSKLSEGGPME